MADQHLILSSKIDIDFFPDNKISNFRNILNDGLKCYHRGGTPFYIRSIFSTVDLPPFCLKVQDSCIQTFTPSDPAFHKAIFTSWTGIGRGQLIELSSKLIKQIDLSNLREWRLKIEPIDGQSFAEDREEDFIVIEIALIARMETCPEYLFFNFKKGEQTVLNLPHYKKIKPSARAALVNFSHSQLANIYAPFNHFSVKIGEENDINYSLTEIFLPDDFYSLSQLILALREKLSPFDIGVEEEAGCIFFINLFSGGDVTFTMPLQLSSLIGFRGEHGQIRGGIFTCYPSDKKHLLQKYDSNLTIPEVMSLNCSILKNTPGQNQHKSLRAIYCNQGWVGKQRYHDFRLKQQVEMHQGFINKISFDLRNLFSDNKIVFDKSADVSFSGCIEIYN